MKIVLFYACDLKDRKNYFLSMLPISLASLGAYLEKKKHDILLINFSKISKDDGIQKFVEFNADISCTMIFSHNRHETIRLIKDLKKTNIKSKFAVAGPLPTFLPRSIQEKWQEIDFILRDEPETACDLMIQEIKSRKRSKSNIFNGQRIKNLNRVSEAAYFKGESVGVDFNEQLKMIMTSRGTSHSNRYFSSSQYRTSMVVNRKVDDVIRQLEYIYKKYGIIYFSIKDDAFTFEKDRVIEFCRKLRKKKLFFMWNCRCRPENIDEEMLNEMKLAGLERILLNVKTGSERLLETYDNSMTVEDIYKASESIRKIGIYFTILTAIGFPDETDADINYTKKMIRNTLPGNIVVYNTAYFPGSIYYESAKLTGEIEDNIWFRKKDPIIYINNNTSEIKGKYNELNNTSALVREKAWYDAKDFKKHKRVNNKNCWITDILEGDYYLDEEVNTEAEKCYRKVVSSYPSNPWGYLRQGKVKFRLGDFSGAEYYYQKVTEILPKYFGGWLKTSEAQIASGNKKSARVNILKAYSLNRFDHRIKNIKNLLKL